MLGKWLSKLCYVHVLEYLSAIKRNEILKHATKWINFKIIMLSGRFKKRKYIVWFQLWITKALEHKNQSIETENILVVAWKWEKDKESWMGKITRTLRSYWYIHYFDCNRGSWCAHMWKLIKLIKTNQTRAWSLGKEDPPEEEMTPHSSIIAWKMQRAEEPGGYTPWAGKDLDMAEQLTKDIPRWRYLYLNPHRTNASSQVQ